MTISPFDSFNDRLARDIRNQLSTAFTVDGISNDETYCNPKADF